MGHVEMESSGDQCVNFTQNCIMGTSPICGPKAISHDKVEFEGLLFVGT